MTQPTHRVNPPVPVTRPPFQVSVIRSSLPTRPLRLPVVPCSPFHPFNVQSALITDIPRRSARATASLFGFNMMVSCGESISFAANSTLTFLQSPLSYLDFRVYCKQVQCPSILSYWPHKLKSLAT
jgi:hypothetical protein